MKIGDLVKIRPKRAKDQVYSGLLLKAEPLGRGSSKTILFDVLVAELDEILTVSDIFFDVWRYDDQG